MRQKTSAAWASTAATSSETIGLRPVIDAVYPLEGAPRAFERLGCGPFGKVVVAVT